ncbi:hypothetical protein [Hyalangium versicolor]|uniref:hypothetical protein n=1 Tax=Hyalangium versicolor TaxID=2861190 RepID=UPI001CD00F1F|nr:hypothetical protein [Hyalangium versicolor]
MSLRTFLHHTALMAVVLLSLPGATWAQIAVSGQVRFADGSIASEAVVYDVGGHRKSL